MTNAIVGSSTALIMTIGLIASGANAANVVSTVDSFEKIFGVTEGKRRNHTKGFCFKGTLAPGDMAIKDFTLSPLFTGESKVIGRLSHKGGNNNAADNKPGEYGMGLSISTASGDKHLMSMNTLDFFPVSTPEAFSQLMYAKTQGSEAVKKFKAGNKDLQRFSSHSAKKKRSLTSYEGSTFNSINSFYLVNNSGEKTAIRWSFVPSKKQSIVTKQDQDFLFENMQKNLSNHGVNWDMVITIANTDDAVNNAAVRWEGEHKKIIAAKLKVISISSEKSGQCDEINFDPLVLSPGFSPSDDPLLQARRTAYAVSFGRRMSEKKSMSAY